MQSPIANVKFKKGLSIEIEVLPLGTLLSNFRSSITQPHRSDFYNIFWIQEGTAELLVDFEPVSVPVNSFLFINRDQVKAVKSENSHDGKLLLFTDAFYAQSESDIKYLRKNILFNDITNASVISMPASPSLTMLFTELEKQLAIEEDAFKPSIAHSILHTFLLLAEREVRNTGRGISNQSEAFNLTIGFKEVLEVNFKQLKSVSVLASKMNMTEKRLTKATTTITGKAPKVIINDRVMLEAKRMLTNTDQSIKEIGYDLGFDDPTYFIKYFRKHESRTPNEFRKHYRKF